MFNSAVHKEIYSSSKYTYIHTWLKLLDYHICKYTHCGTIEAHRFLSSCRLELKPAEQQMLMILKTF